MHIILHDLDNMVGFPQDEPKCAKTNHVHLYVLDLKLHAGLLFSVEYSSAFPFYLVQLLCRLKCNTCASSA